MAAGKDSINEYGKQLSPEDIANKVHRSVIGGMWEEFGVLQFEFLKERGLVPSDRLLDVGCGALRGGIHFVRYLDEGNYFGLDLNQSLIEAGRKELRDAGLETRGAHLIVSDAFECSRFGTTFDMALAWSLLTHLPMNHTIRCLCEVRKVLAPGARFYATFFEAPSSAHLAPIVHPPVDVVTHYDKDPYHYSVDELAWMARTSGLKVEFFDAWRHPKGQRMLCFSL